ncbi:hypothetical protein LT85_2211 [Collimonas arenae]|uniref:Uncharacterized protein n=1 Tax=Collimonas arenae TaxID=279058 RepID=A0A0A1FCI2_9BURK|nr:hypothetical protein [Collimonas arenae]AIY41369.1 hypothetical protein LT85_2211 [Collimonas arenae]
MTFLHYVAVFFAGAFLCNCIPHLASGLRGDAFPTPFAKPRGVGDSSPALNFLWGSANLLAGAILYVWSAVTMGVSLEFGLFIAGFLILGLYLSSHFGVVRRDRKQL